MTQTNAEFVAESYDGVAELYARLFLDSLETVEGAREEIDDFVASVKAAGGGLVLDAGCGPGYVGAYMAGAGLDVVGVDLSPATIDQARLHFPDLATEVGDMTDLRFADASVVGAVARHSIIHMEPATIPGAFAELARVLAQGAPLLVTFFGTAADQAHGESFDHQAATAYCLDPDIIAEQLGRHGFGRLTVRRREPKPTERRQFPGMSIVAYRI